MIRLDGKAEAILSHGVSLSCSGRFRSLVAMGGNRILIQSSYRNLLMCFEGEKWEFPLVLFSSSSYEGPYLGVNGKNILFSNSDPNFDKVKRIPNDEKKAERMFQVFDDYWNRNVLGFKVVFSKDFLDLINSDLPHLEFVGKRREGWKVIQRDIYEGSTVEIRRKSGGFGLIEEEVDFDFRVAVPTQDFLTIFLFGKSSVEFKFSEDFTKFHSRSMNMKGLIANCRYDEMYDLLEVR